MLLYPKTIGKALLCHKATLATLELDLEESYLDLTGCVSGDLEVEDVPDEVQGIYGCFRDEYSEFDRDSAVAPLCVHELPDDREYGGTIGSLRDFAALKGVDEEIPHTTYADESEDENDDTWWEYWESASETFEWVEARE